MNNLQLEVDELRAQNECREAELRALREKEKQLLDLLRLRNGHAPQPFQLQHQVQAVISASQNNNLRQSSSVDHMVQASRPSALLQPFVRKRGSGGGSATGGSSTSSAGYASSSSSSFSSAGGGMKKEEVAESTTDDNCSGSGGSSGTDESPMVAHSGRGPLLNGADPVISESALCASQPPPHPIGTSSVGVIAKRPKFGAFENGQGSARPNSLPLNTLYREGFVADTPSKELLGGIAGGVSGSGLTPGSELITPAGLSQLTQLAESSGTYGVLMAQQTGLTPCQHGPMLIQQGGERPPNTDLRELR